MQVAKVEAERDEAAKKGEAIEAAEAEAAEAKRDLEAVRTNLLRAKEDVEGRDSELVCCHCSPDEFSGMKSELGYRVTLVVSDLGWVAFDIYAPSSS